MNKKLISIINILILCNLFSFANTKKGSKDYNYSNTETIKHSERCQAQDAPDLFVLNALFANTGSPYPTELWEGRDNEQINIFDIAREIKVIASVKDDVLNLNNDADHAILLERLAQMEDIADRALIMEADKWKPDYVNELMKHIIGIRNAGISDMIPNEVDPNNCEDDPENSRWNILNPCNENGKRWSSLSNRLTSPHSEGLSIFDYMKQNEADIHWIENWWSNQTGNSWMEVCMVLKVFLANQRTLDLNAYYWKHDFHSIIQLYYPKYWNNLAAKTFTIWHAYVQEVLSKTKFYYNDQVNKRVCLIRTNSENSLKSNGISDYGTEYTMPSAVYDSFSLIAIFQLWSLNTKVITESFVPHHRIINLYPLLGAGNLSFLETEVVAISGPDLPFDYFYNNNEDLSLLKKRLYNGEGVCKGQKFSN